ncbi:hypothetical protein NDU88_003721 [Pleurodeles waltl]|uniref:Uncharacterized protein n=1 Tax=Pleurodeles waltl TaxID=8319 RepID=A0AAV7QAI0_PLEWA|nr:hypothetical protein NDU88_003721 [Pleurodeles waltl]
MPFVLSGLLAAGGPWSLAAWGRLGGAQRDLAGAWWAPGSCAGPGPGPLEPIAGRIGPEEEEVRRAGLSAGAVEFALALIDTKDTTPVEGVTSAVKRGSGAGP